MCQKCQIQTDENGAFSPGTRDAQAVCCLLLWLWGPNEGWEGKKQRERQREGKRVRKWTLQSDLKFIFNQAPSSQTTMLLGAKRHNFTETNLKTGAGVDERKTALQRQTNKPRNLTVTLKKSNFSWTKLSAAMKYKSTQLQLLNCSGIYIW